MGAGHASATGRFDDEQLFYLQARGITEEEARRLVVLGFLAEVVQKIGSPSPRLAPERGDRGRARAEACRDRTAGVCAIRGPPARTRPAAVVVDGVAICVVGD